MLRGTKVPPHDARKFLIVSYASSLLVAVTLIDGFDPPRVYSNEYVATVPSIIVIMGSSGAGVRKDDTKKGRLGKVPVSGAFCLVWYYVGVWSPDSFGRGGGRASSESSKVGDHRRVCLATHHSEVVAVL